ARRRPGPGRRRAVPALVRLRVAPRSFPSEGRPTVRRGHQRLVERSGPGRLPPARPLHGQARPHGLGASREEGRDRADLHGTGRSRDRRRRGQLLGPAVNYLYTENYGSPDFSVANPKKQGRDPVEIASAKVSPDGKTVTLAIPGLKPVMQMLIKLR